MTARLFPLIAATLSLSGCLMNSVRPGPTEHETRSIERGSAERLHANLRMNAGELRLSGGASNLATGDFTYNVSSWKPGVRYTVSDGRGTLTIEQPNTGPTHVGDAKNRWDVRLNDDIPTDLALQFGAGEARLDLGSLALRNIDIEMGVGELKMDLRGNPKHDYDVRVRGGVGEATIYLPPSAGIYAKASGGIGGIQVHGLRQARDHWVNEAYDTAKVQIRVDVSGGVGAINLFAE